MPVPLKPEPKSSGRTRRAPCARPEPDAADRDGVQGTHPTGPAAGRRDTPPAVPAEAAAPPARESAGTYARPHDRRAHTLMVAGRPVHARPNWGCASVPYLYEMRVGQRVVRWSSPPSEQQVLDALRMPAPAAGPSVEAMARTVGRAFNTRPGEVQNRVDL